MALGLGLAGLGLWHHGAAAYALAGGMAGALLGMLYLVSPAWKIEVVVHEHALEVLSRGYRRFLLPWDQVVKLVAAPATGTCFVDGGRPDRSLLIPGPGASAPYDIENKAALYEAIVARVPAERRIEVETLETARLGDPAGGAASPGSAEPAPASSSTSSSASSGENGQP